MLSPIGSSTPSYSSSYPSSVNSVPQQTTTQQAQEAAASQAVQNQQAAQYGYSMRDGMTGAPTDYSQISGATGVASGSGPISGQQAVQTAESYMGTPYNYPWDRSYTGYGTDPNGLGLRSSDGSMDCSQLTSLAYGGSLPADSVTQGNMGPRLDPSTAQPGDVICFDEHGTGTASHVGIADGYGNVIHASSYTGEVTVTPIADIASYDTWAVRPS